MIKNGCYSIKIKMYCLLSKVFDYDWGQKDDFLGASLLDLTSLQLSRYLFQIKLVTFLLFTTITIHIL